VASCYGLTHSWKTVVPPLAIDIVAAILMFLDQSNMKDVKVITQ